MAGIISILHQRHDNVLTTDLSRAISYGVYKFRFRSDNDPRNVKIPKVNENLRRGKRYGRMFESSRTGMMIERRSIVKNVW